MVGAPPRSPSAPCPALGLCTQLSGTHAPAQEWSSGFGLRDADNSTHHCAGPTRCHSEVPASSSPRRLGRNMKLGLPCSFCCAWSWGHLSPITFLLVQNPLWLPPHLGQSPFLSLQCLDNPPCHHPVRMVFLLHSVQLRSCLCPPKYSFKTLGCGSPRGLCPGGGSYPPTATLNPSCEC